MFQHERKFFMSVESLKNTMISKMLFVFFYSTFLNKRFFSCDLTNTMLCMVPYVAVNKQIVLITTRY